MKEIQALKEIDFEEIWDVVDSEGCPTGRTVKKGTPMQPGDYHLAVSVWIVNEKGEFLISRRVSSKTAAPGMWETTGGSALAGEDSLTAALREVREETGITVSAENAQLVETRPWIDHFDDIWLFKGDFSLADVKLLEGETCDAMLATAEEILALWHSGQFVPTDKLDELLAKTEAIR